MKKKRIISGVTSDLVTDQRVHRFCLTLSEAGYDVTLIGRRKRDSQPLEPRNYRVIRLKLLFEKGFLFYAEFNIRLFFTLLFSKADAFISNDLDTLCATFLASRLRKKDIVYDSHEFFTEVPELRDRLFVRGFWKLIERKTVPHIRYCITVSDSIALAYSERYGIEMQVIRNLPLPYDLETYHSPIHRIEKSGGYRILIYQGSVNVDRGLEEMIDAMEFLPLTRLLIFGKGDISRELVKKVESLTWNDRIVFMGCVPFSELPPYTVQADLGLSIEKPNGLSYTYSLSNKFFDYVQAGIPVLISDLPELNRINADYEVAEVLDEVSPKCLADTVLRLFAREGKYERLKNNTLKAREVLNWNTEREKLLTILDRLAGPG